MSIHTKHLLGRFSFSDSLIWEVNSMTDELNATPQPPSAAWVNRGKSPNSFRSLALHLWNEQRWQMISKLPTLLLPFVQKHNCNYQNKLTGQSMQGNQKQTQMPLVSLDLISMFILETNHFARSDTEYSSSYQSKCFLPPACVKLIVLRICPVFQTVSVTLLSLLEVQ